MTRRRKRRLERTAGAGLPKLQDRSPPDRVDFRPSRLLPLSALSLVPKFSSASKYVLEPTGRPAPRVTQPPELVWCARVHISSPDLAVSTRISKGLINTEDRAEVTSESRNVSLAFWHRILQQSVRSQLLFSKSVWIVLSVGRCAIKR